MTPHFVMYHSMMTVMLLMMLMPEKLLVGKLEALKQNFVSQQMKTGTMLLEVNVMMDIHYVSHQFVLLILKIVP